MSRRSTIAVLALTFTLLGPAAGLTAQVELSGVWTGINTSFLEPIKSKKVGPISLLMLAELPFPEGSERSLVCTLEAFADFPEPIQGVKLTLGGEVMDGFNGNTLQVLKKRSTKTKADGVATIEFALEDHQNVYILLQGGLKKKRLDGADITCTVAPVGRAANELGRSVSQFQFEAKADLAALDERRATLRFSAAVAQAPSGNIKVKNFDPVNIAGLLNLSDPDTTPGGTGSLAGCEARVRDKKGNPEKGVEVSGSSHTRNEAGQHLGVTTERGVTDSRGRYVYGEEAIPNLVGQGIPGGSFDALAVWFTIVLGQPKAQNLNGSRRAHEVQLFCEQATFE